MDVGMVLSLELLVRTKAPTFGKGFVRCGVRLKMVALGKWGTAEASVFGMTVGVIKMST